jgi:hypothetical protein
MRRERSALLRARAHEPPRMQPRACAPRFSRVVFGNTSLSSLANAVRRVDGLREVVSRMRGSSSPARAYSSSACVVSAAVRTSSRLACSRTAASSPFSSVGMGRPSAAGVSTATQRQRRKACGATRATAAAVAAAEGLRGRGRGAAAGERTLQRLAHGALLLVRGALLALRVCTARQRQRTPRTSGTQRSWRA